MPTDEFFLTREMLYQKIWEMPTTKLAKEFGISDVALGKICKKLDVPKPPLGYWSRVQFGYRTKIPPLPAAKKGIPPGVYISPTEKKDSQSINDQKTLDKIKRIKQSENKIPVSTSLRNPHPLVKQTRKILSNSKTDDYGALNGRWEDDCLDIRVSKAGLHRALLLMDALIKALEKNGMEFSASKKHRGETEISTEDVQLYIKLHEGFNRFEKEMTSEEKKRPWTYNRYFFKPSNKFVLTLHGFILGEKSWRDTDTKPLEEKLNKIVADIIEVFEIIRQKKIEEKKQAQRKLEEQRRREEELQLLKEEQARQQQLEQQARNWRRSKNIREYLKACEEFFIAENGEIDPEGPEAKWINWANSQANRLDPLKNQELKELIKKVYLVQEEIKSI